MTLIVHFSSGIPSNFYRAPIALFDPVLGNDVELPGNEWYFHIGKIATVGDFDHPVLIDGEYMGSLELRDAIADAKTPAEAKRLGRLVPMDSHNIKQWNHRDALVAMLECNLAKYQQNNRCRAWLMGTGTARLVEHRPDPIWGDNLNGTGKNLLGHVLELVRASLR